MVENYKDFLEVPAANESELVPLLEEIARLKGLKVFVFRTDELKKYLSNINPDLGIALMAKEESNARWNLTNMKKCYLIKLGK